MDIYRAEHVYKLHKGESEYRQYQHKGIPRRYKPFLVHVPIDFLKWDRMNGIMAFSKNGTPMGHCRCGVIEKASYFQLGCRGSITVALKIMDKTQLRVQHDDVDNEARVMAQLQPAGLTNPRCNPHFLLWECSTDKYNEYIATELASNGSLLQYVRTRLNEIKINAINMFKGRCSSMQELRDCVERSVGNTWMVEGLTIFYGVLNGLAYMHSQNVCHLDLDPNNLVLDDQDTVRIIDFGSSHIMDHKQFAGTGFSLVKYKPLFVAPEVRMNNSMKPPRPGFNGCSADMWSAGVLLYQLMCWGFPSGHMVLTHDLNWRTNLLRHVRKEHPREGENCYLCFRRISLPDFALEILGGILNENPKYRFSAVEVAQKMQEPMASLGTFGRVLMQPYHHPFESIHSESASAPASFSFPSSNFVR